MTQTKFSLGDAAKATGYAKSKISNDIKTGKLSAARDDIHGPYQIDASELIRVYGDRFRLERLGNRSPDGAENASENDGERSRTPEAQEIILLRERLAMVGTLHEAEVRQLSARIEDLRASVADANSQRDRAMTLLTEQIAVTRQLTDQRGRDTSISMPGAAEAAKDESPAVSRGHGLFGLFGRRSK